MPWGAIIFPNQRLLGNVPTSSALRAPGFMKMADPMTSDLRLCLADGFGHWEPQAAKEAPYVLTSPPRLSHYAPQACDKPGKPSTRAALRHSWVPGGSSCARLRRKRASWLNETLGSLASRFCKRHNGSRILLVGDSVMSQWFVGLAASLGQPTFTASGLACNSNAAGTALDYDVGQSATACGGHVHLQYVRNGVLDVNASAEAVARASRGACVAEPASTNQPWLFRAARSDFVVLNRGVWVEEFDDRFVAQVNRTLRAMRIARGRKENAVPHVVWRGTPASIPRCWQLPDPLSAPISFNFSANPALAAERGVALFKWHRFAPQNALARGLVEAEGHTYLDTYQQTALRPGGHHRSRHDCVHWCLPGPPDEWTRLLLLLWLRT